MAYGKYVSIEILEQWKKNFQGNRDLNHSTNCATISLKQLEDYIAELKEKYKGAPPQRLGIYFIRYPMPQEKNLTNLLHEGKKLSQTSLVLVPLEVYENGKKWKDYVLPNPGDLYVLSFSDPSTDTTTTADTSTSTDTTIDTTALCPPKCGT